MEHTADAGQAPGQDRSAGELVKQLTEQVSVLIRDELKLAQVEMTQKGKQAGPEQTVDSVKTDVEEIKERVRR